MTEEKFKIKIIKKASDLEKVAKGEEVMFNHTTYGSPVPTYGIVSFVGEKHFALIYQANNLNPDPDFGGVAWKLYEFFKKGRNKVEQRGETRYPFRVGSEEYKNYESRLTKLEDSLASNRVEFVKL